MGLYTKGAWSGSTLTASQQFQGAFSTTFSWAHAAISSGQLGSIAIASTTANVLPGDLFQVELTPTASTVSVAVASMRTSTAATSRVTVVFANVASTATSTFSGTGRITWVKLGLS